MERTAPGGVLVIVTTRFSGRMSKIDVVGRLSRSVTVEITS